MTLSAGPGDTIRFVQPAAGRDEDEKRVRKYLTEGEVYIIDAISVGPFVSVVWLHGMGYTDYDFQIGFNTCHFEDEVVDMEAATKREKQWTKKKK